MTHVFIVDERTFKYHLEYLFAGTGAKNKLSPFLQITNVQYNWGTERNLVGMIADISRLRIGDNIIFYLQATSKNYGMFFGVFKVASTPFFDENDTNNYLVNETGKGLSFRVLLEPDTVYAKGINEHEYLDSLQGKSNPYDLCWSLIYRKLKGNRGCTMIMDYEYDDLLSKLQNKNNGVCLTGTTFTFDSDLCEIACAPQTHIYAGRRNSLDIQNRLLFKANSNKAFETHLQAYITQNFDKPILANLLMPLQGQSAWIGNEVSCGVGMQRIDILIKQETETDIFIRLIELKDEVPYFNIIKYQLPWYLEWLKDYVIPKYQGKNIHLIPTIIAQGNLNANLRTQYQNFAYPINNVDVQPLQYIGFNTTTHQITFNRYL